MTSIDSADLRPVHEAEKFEHDLCVGIQAAAEIAIRSADMGMNSRFIYCAWFRDAALPADDQDYEWPACFIIEASTGEGALRWGNHLAVAYALRSGTQRFMKGEVQDHFVSKVDLSSLPIISEECEASDVEIGW